MALTPVYGWRYPVLGDDPNVPEDIQNLALDIEAKMQLVDTRLLPPVAELVQSSAQSIANNTWTAITFTTETIDTHDGHSTSTNTSRWTCPTGWAGYYAVSAVLYTAAGVTGVRVCALAKNGTRYRGSVGRAEPVEDNFGNALTTGTHIIQLAVGDYVELHAIHTEGSAINTFAGDPETSSLTVAFLRF